MSREEYLGRLRQKLFENGIRNPDQMVEFYAEMIDDRMEDGMSEEAAVASMEPADSVAEHAKLDQPITALVTERMKESHEDAKKKGNGALWMTLVILGFPVWFPLITAFFVVLLAVYIVLWAVVISLFAVEAAFVISAAGCIVGGFGVIFGWIPLGTAVAAWGIALILIGLALLLYGPVVIMARWLVRLIRRTFRKVKGLFVRKNREGMAADTEY